MARSATTIQTEFASRYLQQLCKHWSHKFQVEFTPEHGVIPFGPGRTCTMDATGNQLQLTLELDDADKLPQMQDVVIDHLKRFAHKEDLETPAWSRLP